MFFCIYAPMNELVIDKRNLEVILNDQKTEIDNWTNDYLCSRNEESLMDLVSTILTSALVNVIL